MALTVKNKNGASNFNGSNVSLEETDLEIGVNGVGIADLKKSEVTTDGGVNRYRLILTDKREFLLNIRNGRKGTDADIAGAEEAKNAANQAAESANRIVSEAVASVQSINHDENQRKTNENARIAGEDVRNQSETTRNNNEQLRINQENTRGISENTRQNNESVRQSNENQRQQTFETSQTQRQTAYTQAETNRNNLYATEEDKRNKAFNDKEAVRDAANQAALDCADTLAALGPKLEQTNEILETTVMSVESVVTYDKDTELNEVDGLSWYINEQNNDIRNYDYATSDCPEVLAIKVFPVLANEQYTITIPQTTNYYPNAKRCVGFNATSKDALTSIVATDGTKHNGGSRTITYTPSANGFIFVSYASMSKDGQTTYNDPTVKYTPTHNAIERIDATVQEMQSAVEELDGAQDFVDEALRKTEVDEDATSSQTGNGTSASLTEQTFYTVTSNNAKITITMSGLDYSTSYKYCLLKVRQMRSGNYVLHKEWWNSKYKGDWDEISANISFVADAQKGDVFVISNRLNSNFTVSINEKSATFGRIETIEEGIKALNADYTLEYFGERIIIPKRKFDYNIVGENVIMGKLSIDGTNQASQGMCISGDYLFNFFNHGYVQIHDFTDNFAIVGEYKMDIWQYGTHANATSFGKEQGTSFPYLYIMDINYANVYVEDMTDESSTLVQTISFDWTHTGTSLQALVSDDGYLYVMALPSSNAIDHITIRRYRLPLISEGATVTLNDADYDLEGEIPYDASKGVSQGGKVFNGKLYFARGSSNDEAQKVEVYDATTFALVSSVPLHGIINEPEDLDFHDGKMYIVGYNQNKAWELSF